MKALLSTACGGPETLIVAEIAEPVPKADQVRIAVHACAVNYPDLLMIRDRYQARPPRPFSPGIEVAGVVDAIGANVAGYRVDDRVMALTGWGGMAEKVLAETERCFALSPLMPFEVAAGFLTAYATADHALRERAALAPGETLLVLGAAGGVGLAAVQLGRAMGARVIGAVSSVAKGTLAREHGADSIVVYPDTVGDVNNLRQAFKQACGPDGADVIYDAAGGPYSEPALRAIAWGGRFLVVGFPAGIASVPLNLPLLKGCSIVGIYLGAYSRRAPAAHRLAIDKLLERYSHGQIHPFISGVFALEQAHTALAQLENRSAVGRLVIRLRD